MLDEEQDEEDEEVILGLDSESETSNAEDLDGLTLNLTLELWVCLGIQLS